MRRLNYFDDNLGFYQSAWLKSTIYMCGKKKNCTYIINFSPRYLFYVRSYNHLVDKLSFIHIQQVIAK